ncbi:cytochrome c3 family protein [Sunxiuqinia sp. A32]|uniref:cytochrome c3 family protein n=1 Tax=Sunxiuqinia sp. A32 TaxID=3461496 RepID=UPI0040451F20
MKTPDICGRMLSNFFEIHWENIIKLIAMPPQLKTLIPLFAVFIILFLVARHFLIPESFGDIDHYRANSINEIAAAPVHYVGNSVCIDCHDTEGALLESDAHAGLSCETCHGPGYLHIEDAEANVLAKPGTRKFCGQCHAINPARKLEVINQIDIDTHNMERENCIDCHNPHAVWELKE